MPLHKASGTDYKQNDNTRSRDHNQGNQERKYTAEQKAEVVRIRRCSPTAFYDILGLEKVRTTVTDTEIKKAYRKISLLTHPDKNGYEHADEAFKMVSRAFGVLADKEKRANYDRFGGDPDSRFGGQQSSPFSGFRREKSNGGGNMWEQELTPEEMFRKFFNGRAFGGFDTAPGFVFNLGGGPGIRVRQFGGAMPTGRPRNPNAREETTAQSLLGLLPLLLVLLLPMISSLFSSSTPVDPSMRFDSAVPPHILHRNTHRLNVDYYVNPHDVQKFTPSQWNSLDQKAEINYINKLRFECHQEDLARQELMNKARGWFSEDEAMMKKAQNMPMTACRRLDDLGQR